jgi:DNA-binding transcriptional LysR family regulator
MRIFVAVAEAQSFAAAGRRLGMLPPAVTRAVSALERRVGVRLLQRTTRVVRLTEAGAHFLADAKRIMVEIDEAEAAAAGVHGEARGTVAVTAPVIFGHRHVTPIMLDFLARHRHVAVRALFLDRIVDLVDEGLDIAVRIAHLPPSSLSAIRVGAVRRMICASPAYLAEHGVPQVPRDLARFDAIVGTQPVWTFTMGRKTESVTPRARFVVNAAEESIAAAVAGQGLVRALSYQVAAELRDGRLKVVLAEYEPQPLPVNVVHAEGRRAALRVRTFIDFAVERLRADPVLRWASAASQHV